MRMATTDISKCPHCGEEFHPLDAEDHDYPVCAGCGKDPGDWCYVIGEGDIVPFDIAVPAASARPTLLVRRNKLEFTVDATGEGWTASDQSKLLDHISKE